MSAYKLNQRAGVQRSPSTPLGYENNRKDRNYRWKPEDIETMPLEVFLIYWESVEALLKDGARSCPPPNARNRTASHAPFMLAAKKRAKKEGLKIPPAPPCVPKHHVPINAPKLAAAFTSKKGATTITSLERTTGLARETIYAITMGQRKALRPATLEAVCAWLGKNEGDYVL